MFNKMEMYIKEDSLFKKDNRKKYAYCKICNEIIINRDINAIYCLKHKKKYRKEYLRANSERIRRLLKGEIKNVN